MLKNLDLSFFMTIFTYEFQQLTLKFKNYGRIKKSNATCSVSRVK